MNNTLILKDYDEPAYCKLTWDDESSHLAVTLEAVPDFCVTANVFHTHETFLSLTADIRKFLRRCSQLSYDDDPTPKVHAADCNNRFRLSCPSVRRDTVAVMVELTPYEDAPWTIRLHLGISRDDLQMHADGVGRIAKRLSAC